MNNDWKKYVDESGGLQFPKYLYDSIIGLMKTSLDLGTMICEDAQKLRAYKEQVKALHRGKWLEVASALHSYGLIQPCICADRDFCKICGGSRYLLDDVLTTQQMEHISIALSSDSANEYAEKLKAAEPNMLKEVAEYVMREMFNNGESQEE